MTDRDALMAGILSSPEVWGHLAIHQKIKTVAEIHRGIAWTRFNAEDCYSTAPRPGFVRGYARADGKDIRQYAPPEACYLNVDPSNIRRGGDHPWTEPKVLVNAARISTGNWRYAAFVDEDGLYASQRFHGIWPKSESISIESLAAILNNPVAEAFVATKERERDITKETLQSIPIPTLTSTDDWRIQQLVREYISRIRDAEKEETADYGSAIEVLCELDATVLRMYRLPPEVEAYFVGFFAGHNRPVPFASEPDVDRRILETLVRIRREPSPDEEEQRETWLSLQSEMLGENKPVTIQQLP